MAIAMFAVAMAMVIERPALASLGRPLADFHWPWLSAASVVAAVGDQVSQVAPVQDADDIDEVRQLDPVHQADHKGELAGHSHGLVLAGNG